MRSLLRIWKRKKDAGGEESRGGMEGWRCGRLLYHRTRPIKTEEQFPVVWGCLVDGCQTNISEGVLNNLIQGGGSWEGAFTKRTEGVAVGRLTGKRARGRGGGGDDAVEGGALVVERLAGRSRPLLPCAVWDWRGPACQGRGGGEKPGGTLLGFHGANLFLRKVSVTTFGGVRNEGCKANPYEGGGRYLSRRRG